MARFNITSQKAKSAAETANAVASASLENGEFYSNDGTVITGVNSVQDYIKAHSKNELLEFKNAGTYTSKIRDTSKRYGAAKEYFNFVLSFDKQESAELAEKFTKEQLNDILKNAIVKNLAHTEQGQRHVYVTTVHTETGNTHIQGFVHDFAVDHDNKTISTNLRTDSNSSIAKIADHIRASLSEHDINYHVTPYRESVDLQADKKTPEITREIKEIAAAELEKSGGIKTPEYNHGAPSTDEKIIKVSEKITDPEVKYFKKIETEAAKEQQAATAKLIAAQHAQAALIQRDEAVTELTDTKQQLENTSVKLKEKEQDVIVLKGHLDKTRIEKEQYQQKIFDLEIEKEDLTNDLEETTNDLEETKQDYKNLNIEFEEVKKHLLKKTEAFENTKNELIELKQNYKNLNTEYVTLKQDLIIKTNDLDMTKQNLAAVEETNAVLSNDLTAVKNEFENFKINTDEKEKIVTQQMQQMQEMMQQQKELLQQQTQMLTAMQNENNNLKTELNETKEGLQDASELIAALQEQNAQLQNQNENENGNEYEQE